MGQQEQEVLISRSEFSSEILQRLSGFTEQLVAALNHLAADFERVSCNPQIHFDLIGHEPAFLLDLLDLGQRALDLASCFAALDRNSPDDPGLQDKVLLVVERGGLISHILDGLNGEVQVREGLIASQFQVPSKFLQVDVD